MTPQEAREILDNWIYYQQKYSNGLPIYDCLIQNTDKKYNITDYTFRGLLCIAYDLKPQEDEK